VIDNGVNAGKRVPTPQSVERGDQLSPLASVLAASFAGDFPGDFDLPLGVTSLELTEFNSTMADSANSAYAR
jgi:hypothetical protein